MENRNKDQRRPHEGRDQVKGKVITAGKKSKGSKLTDGIKAD